MTNLYLLITIIARDMASEYESFYVTHGINAVYSTPASGTANEKTLSLLGLERTEKTTIMSIVSSETLSEVLNALTHEMKIDLPGRGIAVAVPLSGVGGKRTLEYFSQGQIMTDKTEENHMEQGYELIVAIYEKGYTNLVMDAARAAGARGGTTIKAKGTGAVSEKFFGLSLAQEKEIVFIVANSDNKKDIMTAIMHNAGADSKANAITFSLPVSDTAGFRLADAVDK